MLDKDLVPFNNNLIGSNIKLSSLTFLVLRANRQLKYISDKMS